MQLYFEEAHNLFGLMTTVMKQESIGGLQKKVQSTISEWFTRHNHLQQ